jgi:hypothetical protein
LKPIDEMREQLNRLFAESELAPDLQRRFKSQLESWLTKLNIVSREEFDAQTRVLQAAQQQLVKLEQQLDDLKSQLNKQ